MRQVIALVLLFTCSLALSSCTGLTPKVKVESQLLSYSITNQDADTLKSCRFIINRDSGQAQQFEYNAGDMAPNETKVVLLTQFSREDGKRFIPVLTKARTLDVQCQWPPLPVSLRVE